MQNRRRREQEQTDRDREERLIGFRHAEEIGAPKPTGDPGNGDPDRDPDEQFERKPGLARFVISDHAQADEHEREREAVVHAALDIEQAF